MIVLLLAACGGAPSGDTGGDAFRFTAVEQDAMRRIDDLRSAAGLSRLQADDLLGRLARDHSQAMADGQISIGHAGFEARVEVILEVHPAGFVGENVAYNQGYTDPVGAAIDGWLASVPHRRNLLGDFELGAIGTVEQEDRWYFTHLLVRLD